LPICYRIDDPLIDLSAKALLNENVMYLSVRADDDLKNHLPPQSFFGQVGEVGPGILKRLRRPNSFTDRIDLFFAKV